MKKIMFLAVSFILLFILVSCNKNGTHTHVFGEWNVVKEASCTEDGKGERTCDCGEVEEVIISASGHTEETIDGTPATCTESGLTAGKKCASCGEITVNQETIAALDHDLESHVESDENGNPLTVSTCRRDGCDVAEQEYVSGLYDAENNLLASWDDLVNVYGLDVEQYNCDNFANNYLENGTKLVVDNSVRNIGDFSFKDCGKLTNIVLPSNLENIGICAFMNCVAIERIVIPDSVTSIGAEAFKSCTSLEKILLSEKLTAIAIGLFNNCTSLKSIKIPDSITNIEGVAFCGCTSLTDVEIPAGVNKIANSALYECFSLKNINVDENNQYYKSVDGNLYNKDGRTLIQYAIGKKDIKFDIPNGVIHVNANAFSNSATLTSINIPSSVASIGACAFDNCALLKNIYFDGTTEEWETINLPLSDSACNIVIHYDGKMQFHVFGFAGHFGSSGAAGFTQKIVVDDEKVYIDDVLYNTSRHVDVINIEYSDYIYSYIENRKESEKIDVLEKIKESEMWYVLEEAEEKDSKQKIAICYIEGIHYVLTITGENEETGAAIIYRINWAEIE